MVLDLSYRGLEFSGMVTPFGSEFLVLNFAGSNADFFLSVMSNRIKTS